MATLPHASTLSNTLRATTEAAYKAASDCEDKAILKPREFEVMDGITLTKARSELRSALDALDNAMKLIAADQKGRR